MAALSRQITLQNGRKLGYEDCGPQNGKPVFYFHGTPTCRLEWRLFANEEMLARIGVRLIAPDRPGMGLSDFQPGRQLCDWPADVAALADWLEFDRFAVLGYSAGGPYAAACALKIPGRLTATGILSGVAPHDAPGLAQGANPVNQNFLGMARDHPTRFRAMMSAIVWLLKYAPWLPISAQFSRGMPPVDERVMARLEIREAYMASLIEALRQGSRGIQWDTALAFSRWDFRPEEISAPVRLWHGEADQNDPPAMGRYLASTLRDCRAEFFPGEGHISLITSRAEQVLSALAV